jgi:hypothetical protein
LEHVQIQDNCNGHVHEEGAVYFILAEGTKHVHILALTNMFQGDTWIFDAPVVGIDLTTDMKRVLITENYGV